MLIMLCKQVMVGIEPLLPVFCDSLVNLKDDRCTDKDISFSPQQSSLPYTLRARFCCIVNDSIRRNGRWIDCLTDGISGGDHVRFFPPDLFTLASLHSRWFSLCGCNPSVIANDDKPDAPASSVRKFCGDDALYDKTLLGVEFAEKSDAHWEVLSSVSASSASSSMMIGDSGLLG